MIKLVTMFHTAYRAELAADINLNSIRWEWSRVHSCIPASGLHVTAVEHCATQTGGYIHQAYLHWGLTTYIFGLSVLG